MNKRSKRSTKLSQQEVEYIESLLIENESLIKNTVRNTLGDYFEALGQDAIGDLYLLVCEKVSIVLKHSSPQGWLVLASRNVSRNLLKKVKQENNNISFDEAVHIGIKSTSPEDAVYDLWLDSHAPEYLISMLTSRELEVYYKIYIEEKKVKETAAELGVTPNLVRNVHKNLRDKIKNAVNNNKI